MLPRKKPPSSEAGRATDVSPKGTDLEGKYRICVTNWKEWALKSILNIIANDNHNSASDDSSKKRVCIFNVEETKESEEKLTDKSNFSNLIV